jgi:hypothetical protein
MRDEAVRPADIFLVRTAAQTGRFGADECPVSSTCIGDRQRIWLVSTSYSNNPWTEMPTERADTLSRLFRVADDSKFQRIHVFLLVRKTAK